MDCGAGGCERLVAECEIEANRRELRELHAQLFGGHAIAALLFAQEIAGPFGAYRREFHVCLNAATGAGGVAAIRVVTTDVLTTTVAAAATTTAATAAGFVLRFIDLERATAEVLAVQGLHGALRIGARHFHEAEAARLARVAVVHQRDLFDRAVGSEQGAHRIVGGAEGKISNVKFGQENTH